jgi:hypothetical protein
MRKISIPKENAVFWLDKNGRWHNEHGEFQHPRIIAYFHSAIRKDSEGYHVFQSTSEFEERVYFPYEDTALFVFDVIMGEDITLVLNTQQHAQLNPKSLYIRGDDLYATVDGEPVKFTTNSLLKISERIEDAADTFSIQMHGETIDIPQRS